MAILLANSVYIRIICICHNILFLLYAELKKVQRRLQQTRKELLALMSEQQEDQSSASAAAEDPSVSSAAADGEALGGRIADAQRRLRLHLDDLNYIRVRPGLVSAH